MLVHFSRRLSGAPQRAVVAASTHLSFARRFASAGAAGTADASAKPAAEDAETAAKTQQQGPTNASAIAALEAKLKARDEEVATYKKELQYALADGENARRIGREDAAKARDFSVSGFSKDMLEVADTLESAVSSFGKLPKEDLEGNKMLAAIFTGVKMSSSVLLKNLGKHGIEKMDVKAGSVFDPNQHDAIFTSPATDTIVAGRISSVVKPGYTIKERILRAAQVGVAEETKSE